MSVETVARRYASALADVVTKTGDTSNIQTELRQWETMIVSNHDLLEVFNNPSIQQESKEKVLESLIARANPTKTTANFLRVLARNNRLTDIAQINEKFASVLEERSGVTSARITSARPLSEAQKSEIQTNLEKMTGKRVSPIFATDETIIGGVVTRIGSTVYDGSVKTQLENLKQQMIKS
ncbi:MAG TPA: ATP synthase F1 subunit delta [Pyrinomonadaceae bacterium]|nr:ATP synthase F1 subunit delta [Pyrinomonadaceae bacterium]